MTLLLINPNISAATNARIRAIADDLPISVLDGIMYAVTLIQKLWRERRFL